MKKPEYDLWAEALLQEIYYAPEDQRINVVKTHLLKAVQRGYRDGAENNEWWIFQDADLARNKHVEAAYICKYEEMNPHVFHRGVSQKVCKQCGKWENQNE